MFNGLRTIGSSSVLFSLASDEVSPASSFSLAFFFLSWKIEAFLREFQESI